MSRPADNGKWLPEKRGWRRRDRKSTPKAPVSGHAAKNRMTVIFRKKMEGCLI